MKFVSPSKNKQLESNTCKNIVGDANLEFDKIYRDFMDIEPIAGGQFPASFSHLMSGYDAAYYGYLWSKVYAQDMFTLFKAQGLMNIEVGLLIKYRKTILERGNMTDASRLLYDVLGRKPEDSAFFEN